MWGEIMLLLIIEILYDPKGYFEEFSKAGKSVGSRKVLFEQLLVEFPEILAHKEHDGIFW